MLKKIIVFSVIVLILSGCQRTSVNQVQPTESTSETPSVDTDSGKKEGYTTINGMVVKVGEGFVIVDELDEQHEVDSYSVDFNQFIDTEVKATGQYSGDTLFVSEIAPIPTPTH